MTGTIIYILSRAGYRAMNGPLADERRRLAGAEPPAAYVSYEPRLLAGAGWYGYRIALNGGDRSMVERARYMLSERYVIRDGYEYYTDGVSVFGVLLRERVKMYGIGGVTPTPEPDALNFTMPSGGTISLNKIGSPTEVTLEYLIEGTPNWITWTETNNVRSLTLSAGQKVYIRNTSEIQTGFSTSKNGYYNFSFTDTTEAHGNTNSLLCRNTESVTSLSPYCYISLFKNCTSLITAPELPATTLANNCYRSMFYDCTSLVTAPELPATTLAAFCYYSMFMRCRALLYSPTILATTIDESSCELMFSTCSSMSSVELMMNTISASDCLRWMFEYCPNLTTIKIHATYINSDCIFQWVFRVSATGDFYCPAELTIPTGESGIPIGWTRHDI